MSFQTAFSNEVSRKSLWMKQTVKMKTCISVKTNFCSARKNYRNNVVSSFIGQVVAVKQKRFASEDKQPMDLESWKKNILPKVFVEGDEVSPSAVLDMANAHGQVIPAPKNGGNS